jgi:hypothetical protein
MTGQTGAWLKPVLTQVLSTQWFTVRVGLTEVADSWSTPLIETTKMNTELDNNIDGVQGKHQTLEAQKMPDTQQ